MFSALYLTCTGTKKQVPGKETEGINTIRRIKEKKYKEKPVVVTDHGFCFLFLFSYCLQMQITNDKETTRKETNFMCILFLHMSHLFNVQPKNKSYSSNYMTNNMKVEKMGQKTGRATVHGKNRQYTVRPLSRYRWLLLRY